MKSIHKEQIEYIKFMAELAHKTQELQKDFNNLSNDNKIRVQSDIQKIVFTQGMQGVLAYLNRYL